MQAEQWHARWREGRTGFHEDDVHGDLVANAGWFTPGRVLVPLCGMTVDLAHLASLGHEVVGVELSPLAAERLFAREGWTPTRDTLGPYDRWVAGAVTMLVGDVFALDPAQVGRFDRVWDRAALVALPSPMRARYVPALRGVAGPGARVLQNAFTYDASIMDGPPFSVSGDEVGQLYAGATIERVRHEDTIDRVAKFRERGHTWWMSSTYRITLP